MKEKNPRFAAKIEAKAAGADLSDGETDEGSSDDEDDDEVRIHIQRPHI